MSEELFLLWLVGLTSEYGHSRNESGLSDEGFTSEASNPLRDLSRILTERQYSRPRVR
jgi:hypothetical protein